jgi:hypothetical protein
VTVDSGNLFYLLLLITLVWFFLTLILFCNIIEWCLTWTRSTLSLIKVFKVLNAFMLQIREVGMRQLKGLSMVIYDLH